MKILVTGLCTLHWGRLQYGNVGNYYIIEPLFRELHRVFPGAEVATTFQMTKEFIERESITVLPMEWYYAWRESEEELARLEYEEAKGSGGGASEYARYVSGCSLVINVSGDMWGDNAEHVGKRRFIVDLYKMRTAQLLGVPTVLFGGTPGPFSDESTKAFAKEVFNNFDLVVNREPVSSKNLEDWGFSLDRVKDFACPAFIYEPKLNKEDRRQMEHWLSGSSEKPLVGFTIGGFNMPVGPYDMWPRDDGQYSIFVDAIENTIKMGARVVMISHTNGFNLPPNFELINGRDYPILRQLYEILLRRGNVDADDLRIIDRPYLPNLVKSIIGGFDMMITGRVHASVAAISQHVPTVFISYEKSFIPSTKMQGFAGLAGVEEFVCEPGNRDHLIKTIASCYTRRAEIRMGLAKRIPMVKDLARLAFDEMQELI